LLLRPCNPFLVAADSRLHIPAIHSCYATFSSSVLLLFPKAYMNPTVLIRRIVVYVSKPIFPILAGYLLCLLLPAVRPAAADVDCQISAARVGRVFFTGERVSVTVTSSAATQRVRYVLRDFDGRTAATGTAPLGGGTAQPLSFGVLGNGIYYLTLTFTEGQYKDAVCVVPRPDDDPGDPGLWGFQFGGTNEMYYAFMAALGVRHVRFDLSWPDHERTEGNYGLDVANWYATCLQKYGLQMIPTLGYTPGWTAMQPDDLPVERTHVFAPDAVEHWAQFVKLLGRRLGPETITWPAAAVVGKAACATQTWPLVRSWEIWNEADQNYYWGYWGRYLDLLRVASATLKRDFPTCHIAYGGSCAHWNELATTYDASCVPYFDELTWHSGGNMETELPKYYYGAPQLGYRNWLNRTVIQTECYPDSYTGLSEAASLLRLYTVLKAWREEGYSYASIGQRLVGPADPNSTGLGWWTADGQIAPSAKGVAYAVTRWLLMDATYIGPVSLDASATAHLFMKQGTPMLIAWSDAGASVRVDLSSRCARYDVLGRQTPIRGTRVSLALTDSPTIIWGVADSYLPTAINAYATQVMGSEYGFSYGVDSPYVHNLSADCDWYNTGQATRLATTLRTVLTCMGTRSASRGRMLDAYALDLRTAIQNLGSAARRRGVRGEVPTTMWRLVRLAQWVGEVSDALDTKCSTRPATTDPTTDPTLDAELIATASTVASTSALTVRPMSATLLSQGLRMVAVNAQTGGTGAAIAARTAMEGAAQYATLESASEVGIFAVGYFPTAHQLKKGLLFDPGTTHTVQAQVYNFGTTDVSGTITWQFGDTWSPTTASVPFTAPAGGWSDRIPCQVAIPGGDLPWPVKTASNPARSFSVYCPTAVPVGETLILGGSVSDGRTMLPMRYDVSVGIRIP
jgi:hypothetical protein